MMQKSSQYCASCNGTPEPNRTDCVQADPLSFISYCCCKYQSVVFGQRKVE